jgi:hypothetical protein
MIFLAVNHEELIPTKNAINFWSQPAVVLKFYWMTELQEDRFYWTDLILDCIFFGHLGFEINFSSGSICLVLASHEYNEFDYIRDYDEYLKYTTFERIK